MVLTGECFISVVLCGKTSHQKPDEVSASIPFLLWGNNVILLDQQCW